MKSLFRGDGGGDGILGGGLKHYLIDVIEEYNYTNDFATRILVTEKAYPSLKEIDVTRKGCPLWYSSENKKFYYVTTIKRQDGRKCKNVLEIIKPGVLLGNNWILEGGPGSCNYRVSFLPCERPSGLDYSYWPQEYDLTNVVRMALCLLNEPPPDSLSNLVNCKLLVPRTIKECPHDVVRQELERIHAVAMERIKQVWSLTQFCSVDFSKSRINVKKCVFSKRTIKVCVSCC